MFIRPAKPDDIQAVSEVYVESWKSTYEGLAPEAFIRSITTASAIDVFRGSLHNQEYRYFLHVAETPENRIVGFADGGRERSDPAQSTGELYGLYLLKEFQGQGLGRRLFRSSVETLLQSGMNSMDAWILENSPHRAFYEKAGGLLEKRMKKLEWEGHTLLLACYRWNDLKKMIS
jgi:GNAT superfamily N-acetyltransferase